MQDQHFDPLIVKSSQCGGGAPGLRAFAICHLSQVSHKEIRESEIWTKCRKHAADDSETSGKCPLGTHGQCPVTF